MCTFNLRMVDNVRMITPVKICKPQMPAGFSSVILDSKN